MKINTRIFIILLLLLAGSISSCKTILINKVFKTYDVSLGERIGDVSLIDSTGKNVQFTSFQGKVIYLNLWGTWCKPCLEEIPFINQLTEKLSNDSGIVVLNVCVESDFTAWKQLTRSKGFSGTHLFLPNDSAYQPIKAKLRIDEGLPNWRILNKEGETVGTNLGPDEGILTIYALVEAQSGTTARQAAHSFVRLAKSSGKSQTRRNDKFDGFIEKYK